MKKINEYSQDELKYYYKSYLLYDLTYWLKNKTLYNGNAYLEKNYLSDNEYEYNFPAISLKKESLKEIIDNKRYKNTNEKKKIEHDLSILNILSDVKLWRDRINEYYENQIKYFDNMLKNNTYNSKEKEEYYNKYYNDSIEEFTQYIENADNYLHMNDDIDIEFNRPTYVEQLEFIWETLKYLDFDQLKKLCDYSDKKFEQSDKYINLKKRCKITDKFKNYQKRGFVIGQEFDSLKQLMMQGKISCKNTIKKWKEKGWIVEI